MIIYRISVGFGSGSCDHREVRKEEKKMGLLWWRGVVDKVEQKPVGLQALLLPLLAEILVNYY